MNALQYAVDTMKRLVKDWEDQFGVDACDCRPEPENAGHVCTLCQARQFIAKRDGQPWEPEVLLNALERVTHPMASDDDVEHARSVARAARCGKPVDGEGDTEVIPAPTDASACDDGHDGPSWWEYDARGIPLARVCRRCREAKLAGYRKDVLENPSYEADEPIEPEDA